MSTFLHLVSLALFALFFENVVFNGGYGVSDAIRIAGKPKQLVFYSLFVALFSSAGAVICRALDLIPAVMEWGRAWHMLLFTGVILALYLIVCVIARFGLHAPQKTIRKIGLAAFNTLVLAVPLINRRAALSLPESVAVGLGAGFSFLIAALLLSVGIRKIEENDKLPAAFRSTPALFLYVSLLSLAFLGFTGKSLFL